MSAPIFLDEETRTTAIRFREDGGMFIAKFQADGLNSVILSSEEVQQIANYLSTAQ